MNTRLAIALSAIVLFAAAQAKAGDPAAPRFRPVNVYVDSASESLAAYQIEVTASESNGDGPNSEPCAEIVGVEGGEHPAFRAAPYYDPAALRGGRIIVGALSTDASLPYGKTRVAVLHVSERRSPCRYEARLLAAASERGERVGVQVWLEPVNGGSND